MPSGKTHDIITLLLAVPTFLAAHTYTHDLEISLIVTAATLFGGLMFGPDLDINSRQYQRWGPLRLCWWPYRYMFSHRSRFTHGIIFGTALRLVYFFVVAALAVAAVLCVYELAQGGTAGGELLYGAGQRLWAALALIDNARLGAMATGLWWGAASHTITDLVITTIRQIFKLL